MEKRTVEGEREVMWNVFLIVMAATISNAGTVLGEVKGIDKNAIFIVAENEFHKSDIELIVGNEKQALYLNPRQSILAKEVVSVATKEVERSEDDVSYVLEVRFSEEGAKHLRTLTDENVGNRLALFIEGEFIAAPRIQEPIPNGVFFLSGKYSRETLEEYERRIGKSIEARLP